MAYWLLITLDLNLCTHGVCHLLTLHALLSQPFYYFPATFLLLTLELALSTQNRKQVVYIPHGVGQTSYLLLCWPFVTLVLQHHKHTHTCHPLSCIVD